MAARAREWARERAHERREEDRGTSVLCQLAGHSSEWEEARLGLRDWESQFLSDIVFG